MTDEPTLEEKIGAVRSDTAEATSDEPDSLTKAGIEDSERERRKSLSVGQRADLNQRYYYESVNRQNERNERRIEWFETELAEARSDLTSSHSQNINLAERAGKFAERSAARRWLDTGCSLAVLGGTLVITFTSYASPGFGGQAWIKQELLDGFFIAGLVMTAAGGAVTSWATLRG